MNRLEIVKGALEIAKSNQAAALARVARLENGLQAAQQALINAHIESAAEHYLKEMAQLRKEIFVAECDYNECRLITERLEADFNHLEAKVNELRRVLGVIGTYPIKGSCAFTDQELESIERRTRGALRQLCGDIP